MELLFDINKTYRIWVKREGITLTFTGTKVKTINELITFIDKFDQQQIFPLNTLIEAKEVFV